MSNRPTLMLLLTGAIAAVIGCGSSAPAVDQAALMNPKPANILALGDLYATLDKVYDGEFQPTVDKIAPHEKSLIDLLKAGKTSDAAAMVKADHALYTDGIQAAKDVTTDLSRNTSAKIAVTDHDAYVAYYTAVSQRATVRSDEYKAILALEGSQSADTVNAALLAARNVTAADFTDTQLKR